MADKTYNPKKVSIIVGGEILTGFKDGQFFKIEPNSPMYEPAVGGDGEVCFNKNPDKSGKFTFGLTNVSTKKPYVDELLSQQDDDEDGAPIFFTCADGNTGIVTSGYGFFDKRPAYEGGTKRGDTDYTLLVAEMKPGNLSTIVAPTLAAKATAAYTAFRVQYLADKALDLI